MGISELYWGEGISASACSAGTFVSLYLMPLRKKSRKNNISFLLFLKNIYSEYSDDVNHYDFSVRFFPKGIFSSDHFL